MRATNVSAACSQSTGDSRPPSVRNSGVVARSGDCKTLSASHPLGQAMPRFTG